MTRLPIRVRLTLAFALATTLVLGGAALFVYVRLKADLDESLTAGLRTRAAAVAAAGDAAAGSAGDPEDGFAQIQGARGQVLDSVGAPRGPVSAPRGVVERRIAGLDGRARLLARSESTGQTIVVGQSLDDRDETLVGLVTSFAVGGPVAVLLASMLGYALATAGMRPVEAMRRRAELVSLNDSHGRLPLPAAHDEVWRLGRTLNEMLDRLHRSFERERRFVADASHELRTPVAVVKAELDAALRAGDHHPEVRAALLAAVEECDHLAQLAEDLLVLARSGDGGLPVRPEDLDARSLLEGVRDRFADRAGAAGRRIEVEAEPGLTMLVDPLRMRQALGNLVDNALRHGEGAVVLRARRADGRVELSVADHGPGFPDALATRAFERFARADGARTRGGTGLGLAIVRAIAEAHGGTAELVPGVPAVRIVLPQRGLSRRP